MTVDMFNNCIRVVGVSLCSVLDTQSSEVCALIHNGQFIYYFQVCLLPTIIIINRILL
jgi:hypothetical protein